MEPHEKRVYDTHRVNTLVADLIKINKEIYFEPLLWEVMRILYVSEQTAKEYIKIALETNGLTKEDIQWYDKRFLKEQLNQNQRRLR